MNILWIFIKPCCGEWWRYHIVFLSLCNDPLQKWEEVLITNKTARISKQSILKEISPGCSLEELMLKLKLQYFGHLMRRVDSLEKTLMLEGLAAGGEGDDRGWDGWMVSLTRWTWVWVNSGSWWWTGRPGLLHGVAKSRTWLSNWTELNWTSQP